MVLTDCTPSFLTASSLTCRLGNGGDTQTRTGVGKGQEPQVRAFGAHCWKSVARNLRAAAWGCCGGTASWIWPFSGGGFSFACVGRNFRGWKIFFDAWCVTRFLAEAFRQTKNLPANLSWFQLQLGLLQAAEICACKTQPFPMLWLYHGAGEQACKAADSFSFLRSFGISCSPLAALQNLLMVMVWLSWVRNWVAGTQQVREYLLSCPGVNSHKYIFSSLMVETIWAAQDRL